MSDSAGFQFVDTNILVYAHDVSAGDKHERAKKLIVELWHSGKGCISTHIQTHIAGDCLSDYRQPCRVASAHTPNS